MKSNFACVYMGNISQYDSMVSDVAPVPVSSPFSCLLQHTRGCGGPILTLILMGIKKHSQKLCNHTVTLKLFYFEIFILKTHSFGLKKKINL
jgi:hypothetical protein